MPESRHRKINRARKRPQVASAKSPAAGGSSPGANQKTTLIAVIVITAVIAAIAAYVIVSRRSSSQASANMITTASGLKYEDLKVGDGASPRPNQTVRVNYIGRLENGTEFNNSYKMGQPIEFSLGSVIPGWQEGLSTMKVGGKRRIWIPSKLAYGAMGKPPAIPPNSNLDFEIELLAIK